jgi:hypothetical protein
MSEEMGKKAGARKTRKRARDEKQLVEIIAAEPISKKKKSDDEPPAALLPEPTKAWRKSILTEASIETLEKRKLLQEKSVIQWRAATGNEFPSEIYDSETVVFFLFVERGLALPPSDFLRAVLNFYGIELVHLNPNGILHLSIFVHLCEAYLGIPPNFALFRHFFRVKPHPSQKSPALVGGAGVQLRQEFGGEYLDYTRKTTNSDWKQNWFYIGNHAPSLPKRSGKRPEYKDCWLEEPEEVKFMPSLVKKILALKKAGLTGHSVVYDWLKRRIQPLQRRVSKGYEYFGTDDLSRFTKDALSDADALDLISRCFETVPSQIKAIPGFSADNPPPKVSTRCSDGSRVV